MGAWRASHHHRAEPDGFNINRGCGSTDTAALARTVVERGADIGIALDGDADRVVICDETGTAIDGDHILALIASNWADAGRLKGGGVVATVMSNLGLERYLQSIGLALERTRVGDRYVVEHMRAHGFNLGGEQSGHIVMSDHATTGDGLLAALQAMAALAATDPPRERRDRPLRARPPSCSATSASPMPARLRAPGPKRQSRMARRVLASTAAW